MHLIVPLWKYKRSLKETILYRRRDKSLYARKDHRPEKVQTRSSAHVPTMLQKNCFWLLSFNICDSRLCSRETAHSWFVKMLKHGQIMMTCWAVVLQTLEFMSWATLIQHNCITLLGLTKSPLNEEHYQLGLRVTKKGHPVGFFKFHSKSAQMNNHLIPSIYLLEIQDIIPSNSDQTNSAGTVWYREHGTCHHCIVPVHGCRKYQKLWLKFIVHRLILINFLRIQ